MVKDGLKQLKRLEESINSCLMKDLITLVSLRSGFLDNDKIYPPLANLYLHQKIKQTLPDYQVRVTDNPTLEELSSSKYIGVSVMTPQREQATKMLEQIKQINPKAKTIIGGPHVKHYTMDVTKEGWDYVIPLDGIRVIPNILEGKTERVVTDFITVKDYQSEWVKPNRMDNIEFLEEFNYTLNGKRSTTMLTAQGCPMTCFVGGTKVITSNTVNKSIKNIKVGDKLIAFDKGKLVETQVTKKFEHEVKGKECIIRITFEDGTIINCTPEHPFFVKNQWIDADKLNLGDEIYNINFKNKISFYATKYNSCFKQKIKNKIRVKVKQIHKSGYYDDKGFYNTKGNDRGINYRKTNEYKQDMLNLSNRMKKDNPMFNKKNREKATKTLKEGISSGRIIPFMRTQKYWDKLKVKKNKSESQIDEILQSNFLNEWKFTGDGSNRIHYYVPDFTNINGKKKLIEFFGCYWHGCKQCNGNDISKRDKDRIKQFKKLGYSTLVIYQHELDDVDKLIEKIGRFTYNGLKIVKIEKKNRLKPLKVYNMECWPYNNYFAEYLLAHNCTFCEDARTTSRWTPIELIREELDDIKELGYEGVYIFDDLFAIAMPKVRPICDEIFKRDLVYRCNGQANFFTKWGEDFAKMLADSGCVEMAFGHETGSQKILDNITKRTSVEQNYQSVEFARKHGIKVKSFLMLGLPGENYETIAETEKFIRDTGIDDFQLAVYYPYKGTQIRDAIDRGDNSMDIEFEGEGLGAYGQKGGSTEAVVRTSELSSEDLLRERDRLVNTYKPKSHTPKWDDGFFDERLKK